LAAGCRVASSFFRPRKLLDLADYVRYHDTKAMIEDAGNLVRRYPGQFLAAGAILGFLVGRSLRGRDYRA
jgi:hypothetical protein